MKRKSASVLCGYSDRWTVKNGEQLAFHISSPSESFDACLVQLIHGDENSKGPGLKTRDIPSSIAGTYEGKEQKIHTGSFALFEGLKSSSQHRGLCVATRLWPTMKSAFDQGIISLSIPTSAASVHMKLDRALHLVLEIKIDQQTIAQLQTEQSLEVRQWYSLGACFDFRTQKAHLFVEPIDPFFLNGGREWLSCEAIGLDAIADGLNMIVGAQSIETNGITPRPLSPFNGKIESPKVFDRPLNQDELALVIEDEEAARRSGLIGHWDFCVRDGCDKVPELTGKNSGGRLFNRPASLVTASSFKSTQDSRNQRPQEYNALHFHEDDLDDAGWERSFELTVPKELLSGVYAIRIESESETRFIPFFVSPASDTDRKKIAVLIPTLTYLAYQNKRSANTVFSDGLAPRANPRLQAKDYQYLKTNRLTSTYNEHADGSGVFYATTRCPNLTSMNPLHRYPLFDGPHCLGADLHLIDWLTEKSYEFDIITDHLLHSEGSALLNEYDVVVSGSHPEYWTSKMLDAYEEYVGAGGRFLYLGGNGMMFVAAIDEHGGDLFETRRDTTPWGVGPGENCLSVTGEPGGKWARRGRAPRRLLGVETSSMGFDRGAAYKRTTLQSESSKLAFIFDGLSDDLIGDFPTLILGYGAAGYEIDRMDYELGTPPQAVCVASSLGFSDAYQLIIDEVRMLTPNLGGTRCPKVRSDMVFFETNAGGAVFSVGSISWCSALSYQQYDNSVSRVTQNVLDRFCDPEAF